MNNFDINTFDELGRDDAVTLLKRVYRTLNSLDESCDQASAKHTDDRNGQIAFQVGYVRAGIVQVLRHMDVFTSETVNTLD
jgi:hypothetical protein